jgi:hypothetical protein
MERWKERFAETAFARSADTAHDLKTPLNIAVLNLELLRMRVRKLVPGEEDAKTRDYAKAVELELRRLAAIFDAYFVQTVPPRGDESPTAVDLGPILMEEAAARSIPLDFPTGPARVVAHPSRIGLLAKLFFDGGSKLVEEGSATAGVRSAGREHAVTLRGRTTVDELELGKVFKFYYTDASGTPELSLATARLIAETYGGGMTLSRENDVVVLDLVLPQEEQ